MKISAKELLQEDRGNGWHSVPMKERVPDDVKGIVYYPCLTQFEDYPTAEKAFRRIRRAVDYARQKNPGLRGILGLSSHRHWTPYRYETSPRGGKPKKVFNPAVRYPKVICDSAIGLFPRMAIGGYKHKNFYC